MRYPVSEYIYSENIFPLDPPYTHILNSSSIVEDGVGMDYLPVKMFYNHAILIRSIHEPL